MKALLSLIIGTFLCASAYADPVPQPTQNISTCGTNSPVLISAPGATTTVNINNNDGGRPVCFEKIERKSVFPKSGKRRMIISSARLEPLAHFFLTSHGDYSNDLAETAMIYVTLVNISASPILVTGANVDFSKSRALISSVGEVSGSSLSASHATSARILFSPGEKKEVLLDSGMHLKGLASILSTQQWMANARLFDDGELAKHQKPMLAELRMIPEFNRILLNLYGGESKVSIRIYESDYVVVAEAAIPVASGVDYFYKNSDGGPAKPESSVRFDHSAFLAQAMLDFRRNGAGRGPEPVEPQEEN